MAKQSNRTNFLTLAFLIVAVSLGIGIATTWLWLNHRVLFLLEEKLSRVIPIFFFVSCLTFVNLAFRWVRWHFLLNRFKIKLIVRLSLKVYLISLVALLTPFYVGELARGKLYPGKEKIPFKILTIVWIVERLLDVLIMGIFVLSAYYGISWALVAIFSFVFLSSILAGMFHKTSRIEHSIVTTFLVSLSACAWLTTVVAFYSLVLVLGGEASFADLASIFGKTTLLAGLTGIPTGAGVGGSLIILELQEIGLNSDLAVLCTAIFKIATTWIAVVTGFICLFVFRRFFQKEHAKQTHFDEFVTAL